MDVVGIKKHITENPESIGDLLEALGFYKVRQINSKEYRCGHNEDSKGGSIRISIETLSYQDFVSGDGGDIITLIQSKLEYNFPKTLRWLCDFLGLDDKIEYNKAKEVRLPFGGFFKNIHRVISRDGYENKTYAEDMLEEYSPIPNRRFIKDNISIETQLKFNVGYDSLSGRITVPWRNYNGELIGIMGRINSDEVDCEKWFPIIKFSKSNAIYGYSENYKSIIECKTCIITESEKGVMQLDSMGWSVGLAVGGNAITEDRAKAIKSLMCDTIIIAFDEGLDIEKIKEKAELLKYNTPFHKNMVGIIHDKDNVIIEKGSKASPTDLGKEKFDELLNCIIWI